MLSELFTDKASMALSRSLDGFAARHKVIANNIANAETPGFQRSEVHFEEDLKAAYDTQGTSSAKKKLAEVTPEVSLDTDSPARPDGNNVNIDQEVADLAKNTLSYKAATTLLESKGSILKYVVTESR